MLRSGLRSLLQIWLCVCVCVSSIHCLENLIGQEAGNVESLAVLPGGWPASETTGLASIDLESRLFPCLMWRFRSGIWLRSRAWGLSKDIQTPSEHFASGTGSGISVGTLMFFGPWRKPIESAAQQKFGLRFLLSRAVFHVFMT